MHATRVDSHKSRYALAATAFGVAKVVVGLLMILGQLVLQNKELSTTSFGLTAYMTYWRIGGPLFFLSLLAG